MSKILIGSTIPAFAMTTDEPTWHHWLENARQITLLAGTGGYEVSWLVLLQTDARGTELFEAIGARFVGLSEAGLDARWWTFSVDTDSDEITSGNRLASICIGRNLIIEAALRFGHDFVYFADSDISAPDDILPRLLELDTPVCGGHVPTYCLDGPRVATYADRGWDVREHWNTAGSLLVARDVFRRVPWRHDPDAGCTDDPATQGAMRDLGYLTFVRHDVICTHHPESIGALEDRRLDLAVYR